MKNSNKVHYWQKKYKEMVFMGVFFFLSIFGVSTVLADTIILKNGRELNGVVVKETNDTVVLKLSFGNMALEKNSIQEIKRGDNETTNSGKDREPVDKPSSSKSYGAQTRQSTGKMGISELVEELEQIKLENWEYESHQVTEKEKANYKAIRSNGNTELLQEKPKSPDGIDQLWIKRSMGRVDAGTVIYYTGFTGASWRRLYWSESGKNWTENHPGLEVYKKMKKLSNELLKKIIIAGGGQSADYSKLQSAASTLRSSDIMMAEAVEKAKKDIDEITSRVGGALGGTEILRQIISMDSSQDRPDQEGRIRVALEKKDLLIKAARKIK